MEIAYILSALSVSTLLASTHTLISVPELVWGFMLTAIGYRCGGFRG